MCVFGQTVVVVSLPSHITTRSSLLSLCVTLLPFSAFLPHTPSVSRPFDAKNPFLAAVNINRKLNKAGDRHLMHLELDITGSKIR